MNKSLVLCSCLDSQQIDPEAFSQLDGVRCSRVHSGLCTDQTEALQQAIAAGDAVIGCAQEQQLFEEIAEELGVEPPICVDLRDRAGWSDDSGQTGPKMAALVADGLLARPPVKTFDVSSEGLCLILGSGDVALRAAEQLSQFLSVTVLLDTVLLDNVAEVPMTRAYDVIVGQVRHASGALGGFELALDQVREVRPGGRGEFTLQDPKDGGRTECDVIVDLRGQATLFPAPEKREGYLRADPASAGAVADVVLQASHLEGTFEKPFFLSLTPEICAHSRAGQVGCSNCIDICPASAISPSGDHVDVDPMICAGCGSCAALCPSGAIRFDDPGPDFLFRRISGLAQAYRAAGGAAPRLLVHDEEFGAEMIAMAARFGRGLPADVIPMALGRVSGFGHAEMLAALAVGFAAVDVLLAPTTETDALTREHDLALALAGDGAALRLLQPAEPDTLSDALFDADTGTALADPVLLLGNRRQVTRLAVKSLRGPLDAPLPLPDTAPYGAIKVDTDACTLCLSCASLCPAGALGDNPDAPQLRFQEDACLQCGLCVKVCPENALTPEPRFDTSDAAFAQTVLHEEPPFACIECGKDFGVRSTIEKIVEKLEGKHSMFASSDATRLIRMCDDCRIRAQFHSEDNPFAGGERPRVRTTDDYLSKRRDH